VASASLRLSAQRLHALGLPALTIAIATLLAAGCTTAASPALPQPSASAGGLPAAPAASIVTLPETGSTLLFPLLRSWASAYHQLFPQVTILTAGTGSGAGITAASDGTATIGASDAYLSSGNLVSNPRLLNIPLAISAQQVDYNLPSLAPGVHLQLTGAILAGMYSGSITSWNDQAIANLNPGIRLPAIRVVPLHRVESSGDTFLFSSYLATSDPAWNSAIGYGTTIAWPHVSGALAEEGNSGMVAGCRATPGCVAYIGISYLTQALAAGLGEAELRNASGNFELPTAGSISAAASSVVSLLPPNETISMVNGPAATGYPIVNYEYAIVSSVQPSPTRARDLKAFLHWAITTGNSARFLDQVRFEPLPADVATLADAQIASIR
jgi:phosphate transport system substrate-binding protein